VEFACQQGKVRASKARSRLVSILKWGYKWKAVAKAVKKHGKKWKFKLPNPSSCHNNHLTPTEGGEFFIKRLFLPKYKAFIASYLD